MIRLHIVKEDITQMRVGAIVNAANTSLRGGGGVDGAIHKAAGPDLLRALETSYPNGGKTGQAYPTCGYGLPNLIHRPGLIVHAIGPRWGAHNGFEHKLLANAYRNSLKAVHQRGYGSVAFPCLSTGIYGFPFTAATAIALITCATFTDRRNLDVTFCCFSDEQVQTYMMMAEDYSLTIED